MSETEKVFDECIDLLEKVKEVSDKVIALNVINAEWGDSRFNIIKQFVALKQQELLD